MSLSYRQEHQLGRIRAGLCRSDPQLVAMFGIFGRLYPDQDVPGWEQLPGSQHRSHPAAAIAAVLIALATAVRALLAAASSVVIAMWRTRIRLSAVGGPGGRQAAPGKSRRSADGGSPGPGQS